ncbi:FAD-dependent monooxygenase [Boeremia exigua]|uniref:FAD-dependent monooxygenase n=1 Tax=Boeremia exigua TaxID=749465 RepID=UPI001E8E257A|nr:FAD-dependent monooxygenase [Boeremia exigua]KAH6628962.1 FAD-dependent monooxygenase [Boeremia exigua]
MSTWNIVASIVLAHTALANAVCKNHPLDSNWPSLLDWHALNQSTNGALIKTNPVASSCYDEGSGSSRISCQTVQDNWHYSTFHASQPESIGYPYWANNSCVPPNDYAYESGQVCKIGGLPAYVLNATTAQQVATATKWASLRNIRIVIKGTGHDLNGRSSGAHSLSIWTHHFQRLDFNTNWSHPLGNRTENAIIAGSGNNWGKILQAAAAVGRTVVSGQDPTVGLGGFIGGGGHGPLSSRYGLAADQILEATVVTTGGDIVVANDAQNQDLLWAIRGGGPGLYGVVVEYVMRTFPLPRSVTVSNITISMVDNSTEDVAEASWKALATLSRSLPDLMDAGITGNGNAITRDVAMKHPPFTQRGIELSMTLFGYDMTAAKLKSLLQPMQARIVEQSGNRSLHINTTEPATLPSYLALIDYLNPSASHAGDISLISSRLLGRSELTEIPLETLKDHLRNITKTQVATDQCRLVYGLQGGPGPRRVDKDMRGALTPAWRKAYIHLLGTGAIVNTTGFTPHAALSAAATWTEENKESLWRKWAPDSGSYINEANPFNSNFKVDFYGGNYERLLEIKKRYDPTDSLFVQAGVGSHSWSYDLDSGTLCQV